MIVRLLVFYEPFETFIGTIDKQIVYYLDRRHTQKDLVLFW